jgi:mRNA interferase HigB
MVIISKAIIRDFGKQYPDVGDALNEWYEITKAADWSKISDLRESFNSVDYVKNDRFVFNIKGNRYRLVTMIFFDIRTIFIRFVGTHAEYDKIDVSKV